MELRKVRHTISSHHLTMGKITVKQPLPTGALRRVSPFILLHHFGPVHAKPGVDPLDLGGHPHRGFEPVTFLYSGGIEHKDSLGNTGVLSGGDVQWMTAGSGVVHSEKASEAFLKTGGVLEGIQLWINLPRGKKMMTPGYQDIPSNLIPVEKGSGFAVRVVAGDYGGISGPAQTQTPITALQVDFAKHSIVYIPLEIGFNTLVYILGGQLTWPDGSKAGAEQLVVFESEGDGIRLQGSEETRVLLLSGAAIDEPMATYGPFVMNTQAEIMEAIQDFQEGKMGILAE